MRERRAHYNKKVTGNVPLSTKSEGFDRHVPIITTADGNGVIYNIYLTKPIEDVDYYDEFSYVMTHEIQEGDKVNLYISTPGGYVHAAMYIIDAIMECKAPVVGILSGHVASAGTMISMACDNLVVNPHASFMIHNYSAGFYGPGHTIEADFKFTHKHIQDFAREMYEFFVTDEELDEIFAGKDMYLKSYEIQERWEKVLTARQEFTDSVIQSDIESSLPNIEAELALINMKVVPIDTYTGAMAKDTPKNTPKGKTKGKTLTKKFKHRDTDDCLCEMCLLA